MGKLAAAQNPGDAGGTGAQDGAGEPVRRSVCVCMCRVYMFVCVHVLIYTFIRTLSYLRLDSHNGTLRTHAHQQRTLTHTQP
jgi:hypothetical protein